MWAIAILYNATATLPHAKINLHFFYNLYKVVSIGLFCICFVSFLYNGV